MTLGLRATGQPDPMVLLNVSDDTAAVANALGSSTGSAVYTVANTAYFFPVRLATRHTYTKAWWVNGTVVAGNVDVGVYTLSGTTLTRVVASTAEAQAGASVMQVAATFTPTTIGPGLYYLAISCTSGTATFWRTSMSSGAQIRLTGMFQSATSSPLPTSATAALSTTSFCPVFGLSEGAVI